MVFGHFHQKMHFFFYKNIHTLFFSPIDVAMDGKVLLVLNVSDIQDVNMVLAMSLILAIVKKAGVAFFATKI